MYNRSTALNIQITVDMACQYLCYHGEVFHNMTSINTLKIVIERGIKLWEVLSLENNTLWFMASWLPLLYAGPHDTEELLIIYL